MLAHVGWPTVGLAIVVLIGRAIRDKDQTRRLMGLIVVLVAVVVGSVAICVELLGMQMPGFHIPRHDPGGGPGGHRLAPAHAACRGQPGSDRQPVLIGRLPDESGKSAIRAAKPTSSHQQGGVIPARMPGTEHPDGERAGDPRPLRPPAASRYPGSPAPPSAHPPSPAARPRHITGIAKPDVPMHARLSGTRQAGTRDRRGPSVAVRETADGAHRPS